MIARLMYLIVVFFQCHALVLSDYYDLQNKGSRVSIQQLKEEVNKSGMQKIKALLLLCVY